MALSKVKVWSYWEGPKPQHIEACTYSMYKVLGADLHFLNPDNVECLVKDVLNPNWKLLSRPALKADALRSALLATYGGWWWDADTVALRHPQELNDQYCNAEVLYTTWTKPPTRVLNGYIWFEFNNPIAKIWLDRVNDALEKPGQVDWLTLGEKFLTGLVPDYDRAVRVQRELLLPIDIDSDVPHFFEDRRLEDYLALNPYCFGLNHSWSIHYKPTEMALPIGKWSSSKLLIHKLLHHAIQ